MTKQEFTFRPRTRNIRLNQIMSLNDYQRNLVQDYTSSDDNIFEGDSAFNETFDELNNLFEDYSAPDFSDSRPSNEFINTDSRFTWILLWIMNFRIKFNLSDTAIESSHF